MLHLAQVRQSATSGTSELRLLAYQRSENIWALVSEEKAAPVVNPLSLGTGALVLVDVSSEGEVLSMKDAADWVMDLVQKYLITGITPAFLQQEAERAEQWRQSLTLQSQELGRRTLEVEARREQIQVLEESLKRERQQLEALEAELKGFSNPPNVDS